jgi:hypothetical protein
MALALARDDAVTTWRGMLDPRKWIRPRKKHLRGVYDSIQLQRTRHVVN